MHAPLKRSIMKIWGRFREKGLNVYVKIDCFDLILVINKLFGKNSNNVIRLI